MRCTAIQTQRVSLGDSLRDFLDNALPHLGEEDVVVITSKILSYAENSVVPCAGAHKDDLVRSEADHIFPQKLQKPPFVLPDITLKDGVLGVAAGIDESNAGDSYVLLPKDSMRSAAYVWRFLRERHNIKKLGVVVTDSKSQMLRRGVLGIALGWAGFKPLYSYVGQRDLDQRQLQHTSVNVVDALAVAAVFVMGEGAESTPLCLVQDVPRLTFLDKPVDSDDEGVIIPPEEDMYFSTLTGAQKMRH